MDNFIGSLIIDTGFFAAIAYLPLQLYAHLKWEGRWRWFALVPLVVMLPVIGATIVGLMQASNLWPLYLIFASPFASFYLVVLMVLHGINETGIDRPNAALPKLAVK